MCIIYMDLNTIVIYTYIYMHIKHYNIIGSGWFVGYVSIIPVATDYRSAHPSCYPESGKIKWLSHTKGPHK